MQYSIVIPVFNKAALTAHCLRTLRATLGGCGEGEVIVIDNASSDETPQMLAEFPWVRVVRNEVNRGFAGANNQGAQLASGEYLVLLNNDTEATPGWLAAMLNSAADPKVGAVGARLLFPDRTLQHAGVVMDAARFGAAGFLPKHDMYRYPAEYSFAKGAQDLQAVTGACLVTPRALYLELGGLDEKYWNGYEDVDYCLRVREQGLRVVYQGDAVLTHFESQSGTQRFRQVAWNSALLASRFNGKVEYDAFTRLLARGGVQREMRAGHGVFGTEFISAPKTTVICHGPDDRTADPEFVAQLRANDAPIAEIVYAGAGAQAVAQARDLMELRGDRYAAFVDTRCKLQQHWLDELLAQVEFSWNLGAATYAPQLAGVENQMLNGADARCTAVALRKYPAHHRLGEFESLDEAIFDFLQRGLTLWRGTRRTRRDDLAQLPELPAAAERISASSSEVESAIAQTAPKPRGLVSIVMLSWNAVEFTKIALDSIRKYTSPPYEIVIVDNGSNEETVQWLRGLTDARVIFNEKNRGYAGGNNQAIAAASGDYVVLLNNDVIVTEGWLDGLLSAFDRVPGLGISAPRSNKIAGDQLVVDAIYSGPGEMQEFATRRRELLAGEGYLTDRAIGLCLCIDRRVIEEVGGLDERFGLGNFEDDDYSIRVRAAGYKIYVCDDVFIHHFGSQSFAANKVDYAATMRGNWTKFAAKWGFPPEYPVNGYDLGPAIARGFSREAHYFALPAPPAEPQPASEAERNYDLVIAAVVRSEKEWNSVGAFVRRYASAFTPAEKTLLAIAALDEMEASALGDRIVRALGKIGVSPEAVADIVVSDEQNAPEWLNGLNAPRILRLDACGVPEFDSIAEIAERSPSSLRRLMAEKIPA